ncbi:MAG TPA: CehA/McbA family metallohydrolase [Candidatus Hydrogenedens sp.]|nr:CehA/McbA family metallohydrolase [Candidatus Hydrogenedens sp.]HOK09462.1 CehA/McbA family metallohydrolase [Candidatus Hydrogenedens sp.]HOL18947.1 CehA/McbA family metallohydrolase [Candidatus Hydrogenedens sp.]HPP59001.1 CehA/McbA family metallohydrolase [Candidatus Hydrogenedens sp.]
MKIKSPYLNTSNYIWAKGNLHTHTSISDGIYSPQETADKYASMGYQFLMFSDHDILTDITEVKVDGMVIIAGNEITIDGPHILHINARNKIEPYPDRQKVINNIIQNGGFAIISHPNWEEDFNHCPQELLESWQNYTGIEIYNGIVRQLPGNPSATDRWDLLLSKGIYVWGYAHDDAHWEDNYGVAWNVVQVETLSFSNVLNALKKGCFYASSGVEINQISVHGNIISIKSSNAKKIAVVVDYGRRIHQCKGNNIDFEVKDNFPYTYLRFELWGDGEDQAWTQPFFIQR